MKAKLRILLTDDFVLTRLGIRRFLELTFKDALVTEAANAEQMLALVRRKSWDLLLLDLNLPDKNGLDILRDIKLARPELPVLVFSGMGEDPFAVAALNAGASGFVSKAGSVQELTLAILKVLAGGKYMSAALADKLALDFLSNSPGPLHQSLSEREFQVLRLMASGQPVSAIATTLSLSAKTISTYRARLLQKMQMHSNAELTRYAFRHNLVS